MNNARCLMSTAVHQGRIYAIGGYDRRSRLNSIEYFDPKENTWTLLSPMTNARCGHTSVTYGDKIYVIGGFGSDEEDLSSVEVYEIEAQEWTWGPSLNQPRTGCKAVVYRHKIFVLGGKHGGQTSGSVECLDMTQPRPVWSQAADMITERADFGATVVDDRILVMGGFTREPWGENKAEAYCGDKEVWTQCPEMTHYMSDVGCMTVRGLKNARKFASQKNI